MIDSSKGSGGRQRRSRNTVTTKSGNTIKLNRTMGDRRKASKLERQRKKALYLSTLPKNRFKRVLYRMHPQHLAEFWFSREGAIMALKVAGIGIVVCFFLIVGVFAYFRKDLPKIKDISGDTQQGSITYYDRTGKIMLWQDYNATKRIPVEDNQISQYMKDATVAVEDKDFYKHGAFDIRGILRAGINDLSGGSTQGGSTITQQLVKLNENWTNNRTVTRKVKELILAVELEREYSKSDILTGYLNIAPYGSIEVGVESAARDYFGVGAKDLSLAQAAMLAAIPKAPGTLSPYDSPKWNSGASDDNFDSQALINRQHLVLDDMVQQGYITQAQADAAKKVDILKQIHPLQSLYQGIKAPYFVLAAKSQLEQKYGATTVNRGGWKVTTTLDLDLQNEAEQLVKQNLSNVEQYGGDEEATVMEDVPTGQIVALVGGVDFSNPDYGKINYADSVRIPPGSSFKPYDYTTFINNNNAGAGSVLYDTQGPLPGYPCTDKNEPQYDNNANCLWDYDFRYPGPLTLRYALAGSRNVPAVKAMIEAVPGDTSKEHVDSVDKVIDTAKAMMGNPDGYACYAQGTDMFTASKQDETQCYDSSAIGDGAFLHLDDHVNGLATIGRLGKYIPRTFILKITDSSGKTVDQWTQSSVDAQSKQVVKPDAAYIVDDMLSDPNASYLSYNQKFQHQPNGWHFAVKTGTTNDNFDGLMTSWSTKYAVVSWVGYHTRNKAMTAHHMEDMTEPLTRGLMEYGHRNLKPDNWVKPSDIKMLPAFVITSHVGLGSVEPTPRTDVYPSWYKPNDGLTSAQTIDKVSGKLATSCTPDDAKQTIYNTNANGFSVDIFVNGGYNPQSITGSDNIHHCGDSPPSVTLTAPDTCDGSCTLTATVTAGTYPLSSSKFPGNVSFSVGGTQVKSFTVTNSPSTVSFQYSPSSSGSAQVVVTATDSVLYQGSDSKTVDFTPGGGGSQGQDQSLNLQTTEHVGGTANFIWDTIPNATNFQVCWKQTKPKVVDHGCHDSDSSNSDTITSLVRNHYYVVTVTAYDDNNDALASGTASFTEE